MTLEKYIKNLIEFGQENPELMDKDVIYSIDDEGNGYNGIYYSPSVYLRSDNGETYSIDDLDYLKEIGYDVDDLKKVICIN